MNILQNIFSFLCAVCILITVHEFGHFWMAKLLGVKVHRFSIGFGKALLKHRGKDDTDYILAAIPLGGYVKMLDSRDEPTIYTANLIDRHRAFDLQPLSSRLAIICAGPIANILFAFIAYWIILILGIEAPKPIISHVTVNSIAAKAGIQDDTQIIAVDGNPTHDWQSAMIPLISALGEKAPLMMTTQSLHSKHITTHFLDLQSWRLRALTAEPLASLGIQPYKVPIPPIIGHIKAKDPAFKAGLKSGDHIIRIDEEKIKDWSDLITYIRAHPKQSLNLQILRQTTVMNIEAFSDWKFGSNWKVIGYLGMEPLPIEWPKSAIEKQQYPLFSAWIPAFTATLHLSTFNFIIIWKMITGKISLLQLGGPISIFKIANRAFKEGAIDYLEFLAMISISLGCLNILPIPGLDGGHLLFLSINSMRKHPISLAVESLMTRLGIIFLLVLLCHATINDLMRLWSP